MQLRGKRVTVIGVARSGIGAANLLARMGAEVTITDTKRESELQEGLRKLSPSVVSVLGGHPDYLFDADLIVISPGVPLEAPPIARRLRGGAPVIGELELAYELLGEGRSDRETIPPFLAVTGSNGKSTTTTLLDEMVRENGCKTIFGGNIGTALTEEIAKRLPGEDGGYPLSEIRLPEDFVVAEVSSFQLETVVRFRPRVAAVLNLTPDHLDRYRSFQDYIAAKARVFLNQEGSDFLVLNAEDPEVMRMKAELLDPKGKRPTVVYFSRSSKVEGLYAQGGVIYANSPHLPFPGPGFPFINANEIRLKGVHNLENAMAASAMALLAGCRPAAVAKSLKEFAGLEHRLEFVREFEGVRYFNDSKGTNVGAVVKSLESFDDPVILLAGGRDKAGDFSLLRESVARHVKTLVLIGEAAGKIRTALSGCAEAIMAADLREAVAEARLKAGKGDIVLLSPACASFDMFRDFEDRGRQFKKIVGELGNG